MECFSAHDQAIRLLALQAINRDLRVFLYHPTQEFYASSYSEPDVLHRVTAVSCDCPTFIRDGRCEHHSLLLYHLGELPPAQPSRSTTSAAVTA